MGNARILRTLARDMQIANDYKASLSIEALKAKYALSDRTISRALKRNNLRATVKREDFTGKIFTNLTVLRRVGNSKNGQRRWECGCICGNKIITRTYDLVTSATKSCGCYSHNLFKKMVFKHGQAKQGEQTIAFDLLCSARKRAKESKLPFNLELSDIVVPKFCPILGLPLERNKKFMKDNSATLDRLIPKMGYIKENVTVISLKANRIKNDATLEEIEKIYLWMKKKLEPKNGL